MNPTVAPFAFAAFCGLLAWGAVTRRYLWPRLRERALADAVEPVLYLHTFRFIGLAFIAPGVVGVGLSPAWAYPAALGDVAAALLAALALLLLRTRWLRPALWLFSAVGVVDLLRAGLSGQQYNVPAYLQSTFFIPVLGVPLLLWTHAMVVAMLLRRSRVAG